MLNSRTTRIVAVLLASICVSGVLVFSNLLLADELFVVPFLFAGYVAIELLASTVKRRTRTRKDTK